MVLPENKQILITNGLINLMGSIVFLILCLGLEYAFSTTPSIWWSGLLWSVVIIINIPIALILYRRIKYAWHFYLARCIFLTPIAFLTIDLSFRFAFELLERSYSLYVILCTSLLGYVIFQKGEFRIDKLEMVLNRYIESKLFNLVESRWDLSKEEEFFENENKNEGKYPIIQKILKLLLPFGPFIGMSVNRYFNPSEKASLFSLLFLVIAWVLVSGLSAYIGFIRVIRFYEKRTGKPILL